jgi:hypothetical protein
VLVMVVSVVSVSREESVIKKRRQMLDDMRMSSRMDIHILCRLREAALTKLTANERIIMTQ